jgi:hypothetical protein
MLWRMLYPGRLLLCRCRVSLQPQKVRQSCRFLRHRGRRGRLLLCRCRVSLQPQKVCQSTLSQRSVYHRNRRSRPPLRSPPPMRSPSTSQNSPLLSLLALMSRQCCRLLLCR